MKTVCGATLLPSSFLVVVDPSSPFGSQLIGNPNDEGAETTRTPVDHSGRFNWLIKIRLKANHGYAGYACIISRIRSNKNEPTEAYISRKFWAMNVGNPFLAARSLF